LNSHFGTVNTVLFAQLEPNSIPRKNNATTALKDSSEIYLLTTAFQDFENDPFIQLICLIQFTKKYLKLSLVPIL
jgi:hypothetical protein